MSLVCVCVAVGCATYSGMFYDATAFSQKLCWNLKTGVVMTGIVTNAGGASVTGGPQYSVHSSGSCICPASLPYASAGHGQYGECSVFQPADRAALVAAVDAWCSDKAAAQGTYGDIGGWDTSRVTSFHQRKPPPDAATRLPREKRWPSHTENAPDHPASHPSPSTHHAMRDLCSCSVLLQNRL